MSLGFLGSETAPREKMKQASKQLMEKVAACSIIGAESL